MKIPLLIIWAFALIVIIIPLNIVNSKGSYISTEANLPIETATPQSWLTPIPTAQPELEEEPVEEALNVTQLETPYKTLVPLYQKEYFNIYDISTGLIERVSVRDYVIGAVAAEMPVTFHTEALKAQAVASHSYALRLSYDNLKSPDSALMGGDFAADPTNRKGYMTKAVAEEFYGEDFSIHWDKISQAVDAVLGDVMVYNEQPIVAAYHSTSTGVTEAAHNVWSGSADYLMPVSSQGDLLSPSFEDKVIFSKDALEEILLSHWKEADLEKSADKWIDIVDQSESGYIVLADVGGVMVSGMDIRNALELKSSSFNIEVEEDQVVFTTYGYGHGVGLSQYGADYMARQGYNYMQILNHYYTGIEIVKAN